MIFFFFFFCPLYCYLVRFRRSAAGQYNVSMQPMPRLSCTHIYIYIYTLFPHGQTNVKDKCQGKVHHHWSLPWLSNLKGPVLRIVFFPPCQWSSLSPAAFVCFVVQKECCPALCEVTYGTDTFTYVKHLCVCRVIRYAWLLQWSPGSERSGKWFFFPQIKVLHCFKWLKSYSGFIQRLRSEVILSQFNGLFFFELPSDQIHF